MSSVDNWAMSWVVAKDLIPAAWLVAQSEPERAGPMAGLTERLTAGWWVEWMDHNWVEQKVGATADWMGLLWVASTVALKAKSMG